MASIVSVNQDLAVFDLDEPGHAYARLSLVLTDTDGQLHRLTLERTAIAELAELFRGIQTKFPGILGGH